MGVINITPDSFSDGGRFLQADLAVAQAEIQLRQGADVLDLGAQSTRPGAGEVGAEEEKDDEEKGRRRAESDQEQVRLQASVTALKPRKCVIEWELLSLSELDRKGAPVRHAFGSADFLLARK